MLLCRYAIRPSTKDERLDRCSTACCMASKDLLRLSFLLHLMHALTFSTRHRLRLTCNLLQHVAYTSRQIVLVQELG